MSYEFEQEWAVPDPVMTNREKVIMGFLSLGEFLQWLVVGVVVYLESSLIPLDFLPRTILTAGLIFFGIGFIHIPTNGLTGLEWIQIYFRYRQEEREGFHRARAAEALVGFGTLVTLEDAELDADSWIRQSLDPLRQGEAPTDSTKPIQDLLVQASDD